MPGDPGWDRVVSAQPDRPVVTADAASDDLAFLIKDRLRLQEEIEMLRGGHHPRVCVQRLLKGQHVVLEVYRSLSDKLALLDAGIDTHDGDIICQVGGTRWKKASAPRQV